MSMNLRAEDNKYLQLLLITKTNNMKIIQGIVIGAFFSALVSAICAYYVALTSETVSDFGLKARDFWWLAIILGGFVGFILGGFVGAIVSGLNLNVMLSAIVGLLITGLPAVLLSQVSESKFDENHTRFGIALIFVETITGIVVSSALRFILYK